MTKPNRDNTSEILINCPNLEGIFLEFEGELGDEAEGDNRGRLVCCAFDGGIEYPPIYLFIYHYEQSRKDDSN